MNDIIYKDYTIEVMSLALPEGRWRPRAVLSLERKGALTTFPTLSAPDDVTFPSEAEADACAIDLARRWIDERD